MANPRRVGCRPLRHRPRQRVGDSGGGEGEDESQEPVVSHMSHIYALVNQKGGVGKTTTAINLGAYLAQFNQRVLLVDLDPQANTTSCLGIDKRKVKTS